MTEPIKAYELRKLPAVENRVETGPTQFGEDWPGVFIRGDNALWFAMVLDDVLGGNPDPIMRMNAEGIRNLFRGCDARTLQAEERLGKVIDQLHDEWVKDGTVVEKKVEKP